MNKDLVERLRSEAETAPHEVYPWLNPLLIEAADEVERLQALLKRVINDTPMYKIDQELARDIRAAIVA